MTPFFCVNAVSAILDIGNKCPKQRQLPPPPKKTNFKGGVAFKSEKLHLFKRKKQNTREKIQKTTKENTNSMKYYFK